MHRGYIAAIGLCALVISTVAQAQQTTIINHYLGNEPTDGQMMQYVLRSTEEHSVVINYYEPAGEGDEGRLAKLIADALNFYIDRSVLYDGRTINLRTKPAIMRRDLDQIVQDAVRFYHFHGITDFSGFSDEVTKQLEAMNGLRYNEAWNPELMGSAAQDQRFLFVESQLNALKHQLQREVGLFTGNNLMVQVDSRQERLKAEQDSLLAEVRSFKTNDPLAPLEVGFSTETLNLLAGDDSFILPPFSTNEPDDFANSDLAARILNMLETQNSRMDVLSAEVDALRREQRERDEAQRNQGMRQLQEQIDLLRELVMTLAADRGTAPIPSVPSTTPASTAGGAPAAFMPPGSDFTFSTGSTTLAYDDRVRMNEVVATLAQRTDLRVMLTGYADASGNREANLRLSRLRAQAVRDYLLTSGLPAHRILINFFGDEKAQGSHTDRRVELRYIPRD